jgi:hypothetical protein
MEVEEIQLRNDDDLGGIAPFTYGIEPPRRKA